MKKIILIVLSLIVLILSSGCDNPATELPPTVPVDPLLYSWEATGDYEWDDIVHFRGSGTGDFYHHPYVIAKFDYTASFVTHGSDRIGFFKLYITDSRNIRFPEPDTYLFVTYRKEAKLYSTRTVCGSLLPVKLLNTYTVVE